MNKRVRSVEAGVPHHSDRDLIELNQEPFCFLVRLAEEAMPPKYYSTSRR